MAAEFNTGFYGEDIDYGLNRHAASFQSGALSSLFDIVQMGDYFGLSSTSTSGMMYSNSNPVVSQAGGGNPCGSSLLLDPVPGLKQDSGLADEWSVDELYKLQEGLVKYADEPSINRYIKIAAILPDKTVRDVALRCSWMIKDQRKPEEHNLVKKFNNRKDKLVESSSKQHMHSTLPPSKATYSRMSHNMDESQRTLYDVSGIGGHVKQLLKQNFQAFSQITANLSTCKLQDNVSLFGHTRHNISTILNDMRKMPGIMSQMPPLPVSIDETLASSILPNKT